MAPKPDPSQPWVDKDTGRPTSPFADFIQALNRANAIITAGALLAANNLSDLVNAASARFNIGLGNVDNTSDVNKPVSTAQAAADAAVLAASQPLDSDLTTIAGLTATTDSFLQAKSSAWASRTIAQVKSDLGLTGTNSGDQTITLTGDVTGSGTGSFAATIGATKVTSAMLNADVFSTAHSWGGTQTFTAPVLGTPTSATLTNATGLPTTGLTGTLQAAQEPAHTGDVTNSAGSLALAIGATKVTSAMLNADVFSTAHSWGGVQTLTTPVFTGLPTGTGVATANTASTLVARDASGNFSAGTITAALAGNASTVTTNANLTGVITSSGNATSIASQTGTGTKFVVDTSPTIVTPVISGAWTATASQKIGPGGTGATAIHFDIDGGSGSGGSGGVRIFSNSVLGAIYGTEQFLDGGVTSHTKATIYSSTSTYRLYGLGAGTLTTDASGNIIVVSDETLKVIHSPFAAGLDAVLKISPILYSWNEESGNETAGTYAGFSAQNVRDAIPEAVGRTAEGKLTLQDRPLIAALVNAVKELDAEVRSLKDSIAQMRSA